MPPTWRRSRLEKRHGPRQLLRQSNQRPTCRDRAGSTMPNYSGGIRFSCVGHFDLREVMYWNIPTAESAPDAKAMAKAAR